MQAVSPFYCHFFLLQRETTRLIRAIITPIKAEVVCIANPRISEIGYAFGVVYGREMRIRLPVDKPRSAYDIIAA